MNQEQIIQEGGASFAPRIELSRLRDSVERVRAEIGRVIVGQHEMVDLLIVAILADGHVLIEGVPGIAKTLSARLLARTLSVGFSRIQFTPDLMPSDIIGTSVFNQKTIDFEFRPGPIFSNFILVDEVNRAPAKTQSALFEVMEERQVTVDGMTHVMSPPYIVVATQNPLEQEGTYRLPEAQLDRFLLKIRVEYPTLEQEVSIIEGHNARGGWNDISIVQAVMSAEELLEHRASVRQVRIDRELLRYIATIVDQTRNNSAIYLGASPRASLAIVASSKAIAAMQGRDFVLPDDIRRVLVPVLQHRIVPTPERELEGITAEQIIAGIIEKVEVPRGNASVVGG